MNMLLALLSCACQDGTDKKKDGPGTGPSGPLDPGTVVLHRLNRTEYDNTVRDLLGTELTPAVDFPTDDMVGGFDNIASNLTVSPLHVELYELAAQELAAEIVAVPPSELFAFRAETEGPDVVPSTGGASGAAWNLWSNGTLTASFDAPADGRYQLSTRVWASQAGPDLAQMVLGHDNLADLTTDVTAGAEAAAETFTIEVDLAAGAHSVFVEFLNDYWNPTYGEDRNLYVDWLDVYGPIDVVPGPNPLRDRWVTCDPAAIGESTCAEEVLRALAYKAWRRPVTEDEIGRLMGVVDGILADEGTFDDALEWGIVDVLVSPYFIFRAEIDPDPTSEDPHALSDHEVASRLSYFLWSTMPDDELFAAAEAGELQTAEQVEAQVRRMLADPKAQALVDNFGGQWLFIRGLDDVFKDPVMYPDFDDTLRASMKEEMARFFEAFVFGERDLRDLLVATEGEIDRTLADHYGIPFSGTGWQTVDLLAVDRGGLLGQAGTLAVNAYPARTSPVIRGKYVLGQLLCDEPPPPPPNVPTLDDDADAQTLREQLEQHRADPVCASCHQVMDEIGFALENYDTVGAYRVEDNGFPIDASGALPDGTTFEGMRELAEVVAADPRLPRCMAEKLLTYGIGRIPEESDDPFVDDIEEAFVAGGYTFESLAVAVATSASFRMRRGVE